MTPESRSAFDATVLKRFVEANGTIIALGTPEESDVPPQLPLELLAVFLREPVGPKQLVLAVRGQKEAVFRTRQVEERLVGCFVRATLMLMEQRDPTVSGHGGRVAEMAVRFAQAVDEVSDGPLREVHFSPDKLREIRYAALLGDIGKIGVSEQVLVKSRKLYEPNLALVMQRHGFIRRTTECDFHRLRAEYLEQHERVGYDSFLERLSEEHGRAIQSLDEFLSLVMESNEPTALSEGNFEELLRYADVFYEDMEGRTQPYLTDDEVRFLTIRAGCLDERERLEIESHVNHTYQFLHQIPWTEELQDVPQIAFGHHEKLDGTGYPLGVSGEEIRVQTRMITIADIFDALTATDRPYKRGLSSETALDILASEVSQGKLDEELFEVFRKAKIYQNH